MATASRRPSTATEKLSEKQLRKQVSDLFDETLNRYPNQDVAVSSFLEDWQVIAVDEGWERFRAAVKKARMECKFFPHPAEILNRLPAVNSRPVMAYRDDCERCWGLGWRNVGPADPTPENPN